MTLKIIGPYSSPTLYSSEPGRVYLTSSDPSIATVPEYVDVPGNRNYRVYNSRYGEATKGNATINAATAGRDQVSICMAYDLKNSEAMTRHLKAFYSPTLAMSMQANATNRMNWAFGIYHYNENQSYFRYRQSVDNATIGADYACGAIGNGGIFINRHRIKMVWVLDGTTVYIYWKYLDYALVEQSRSFARLQPIGTMGDDVLAMIGCEDFAYYNRKLDANERASYYAGTFPSDTVCAYPMNEETGVKHYDLYGANDTELGIDQTYGFANVSLDNRNFGPNRFAIDTVPVEPWQAFSLTPLQEGEVTITATRRRQGVPDRASEVEKFETATAEFEIIFTHGKDFNRLQSVVLANHDGLEPVEDMTIAFRTLVTSLPTASTKMIDCSIGADDQFASWQVILNPAGTLTLGGMSGSSYVSVTSNLTIFAGVETAVIIKKDGTSIDLIIGDNTETLTLATDWDYWSSDVTIRIGDVGFIGAVWDLYTFTRLIAASEVTKFKAGYRVSTYAYHNSLQTQDGKISGGYVSGFLDL